MSYRRGFAVSGVYICPATPPPSFLSARASIRVPPTLERVFGYADVNNYTRLPVAPRLDKQRATSGMSSPVLDRLIRHNS